MSRIRISVIIPVYKTPTFNICLDALRSQSCPAEDFEVIVVNNDPEIPLNIVDQKSLDLKILNEDQPGSYAARNAGLRRATGDIIAFTDADCIPDSDWLKTALEIMEKEPDVFYLVGAIKQIRKNKVVSDASFMFQKLIYFHQEKYFHRGFGATANLIVRKEIFETAGVFNDSLLSGGDFEFGMRVSKKAIGRMYAPTLIVYHPVRSLKDLIQKTRRVVGGGIDMNLYPPLTVKFVLRTFLPPRSFFLSLDPALPLFLRCRIAAIHYCLKVVRLFERIRLKVFKASRLR